MFNKISKIFKEIHFSNQWYDYKKDSKYKDFFMTETFYKEYGFDAIIFIPNGFNIFDLRKLIPEISALYNANIIIEPSSTDKRYAYMRVHIKDYTISDKDNIKFKWYSLFNNSFRNDYGETFTIDKIKNLVNPNDNSIVGYKLFIKIPVGLSYNDFIKQTDSLYSAFGKYSEVYNKKTLMIEVNIITKPLSNEEPFIPIKVKPYELYLAMAYDYTPIICNFKHNCNLVVSGKNGTGKTVSVIQAAINLSYWCDDVEFYIGFTTFKTDLRILKDLKQTKSYETDINGLHNQLKYLCNLAKERNKTFTDCKEQIFNIYEYNDYAAKHNLTKMNFCYFISDEITDFMPKDYDDKQTKQIKNECVNYFWDLARLARSAGIYIIISAQRLSRENMSAEVKAQMGNRIAFYQPNMASSLTVFGNGEEYAKKITQLEKTRECYIENFDGIFLAKTLYMDTKIMKKYTEKNIEKNKKYLNFNENYTKNTENEIKNNEKSIKISAKHKKIASKYEKTQENTPKIQKNCRFIKKYGR